MTRVKCMVPVERPMCILCTCGMHVSMIDVITYQRFGTCSAARNKVCPEYAAALCVTSEVGHIQICLDYDRGADHGLIDE